MLAPFQFASVRFGVTTVLLGLAAFTIAFTADDFKRKADHGNDRKRLPGWVGRAWFLAWGSLFLGAGVWALLGR